MKLISKYLFAFAILGSPGAFAQQPKDIRAESADAPLGRIYGQWTVFHHPRFGYELPVPPRVRSVGVPETASQTRFVSPDGAFTMSAWGGRLAQSADSLLDAKWRQAHQVPDRVITYSQRARTWIVVSGSTRSGMEFYEKCTTRGSQVAAFTLTYPRARLREFAPWVETIENAFRAVTNPGTTLAFAPAYLLDRSSPATFAIETPDASRRTMVIPAPSWVPAEDGLLHVRVISSGNVRNKPPLSTTINMAPPPDRNAPSFEPTNQEQVKNAPELMEAPAPGDAIVPTPPREDLPFARKVVGKEGMVYSPFFTESIVDVAGIKAGTKVKCPYTDRVFMVP